MPDALAQVPGSPDRRLTVSVLGCLQILSWGSTFYLLAVLGGPIVRDTGWPYDRVMAGLSVALLVTGLVSPRIGRAIGLSGGRGILALGAAVLALGFVLIGAAQNLAWYFAGWAVLGVGMGAGLYDAAFATLGSIYGRQARGAIAAVTLFGGFASTVCWPFSAFLVERVGWRAACFVYAGIYLAVAVPLYLVALPRPAATAAAGDAPTTAPPPLPASMRNAPLVLVVLGAVLTISAAILAMVGSHLVTLMQARGLSLAAAVGLGMLIGPSAVGARLVETLAGSRYHPIWTMVASAALVALAAGLFLTDTSLFAVAIVLYAAGNGIGSIAKGTLPLALVGPARYPALAGRLALPIMFAMALAPYAGALAFQRGGATATLLILLALALSNVVLVALLWTLIRGNVTADG